MAISLPKNMSYDFTASVKLGLDNLSRVSFLSRK